MHLTNQILATKEQIMALINDFPADQVVVMINLLKFNGESGRESYQRYSKNVAPLLAKAQGKVLWAGNVNMTLIGDSEDHPDMVLIVQYPSKQHFIGMATSEEYKKISHDREVALTYGGLLASTTINFG